MAKSYDIGDKKHKNRIKKQIFFSYVKRCRVKPGMTWGPAGRGCRVKPGMTVFRVTLFGMTERERPWYEPASKTSATWAIAFAPWRNSCAKREPRLYEKSSVSSWFIWN